MNIKQKYDEFTLFGYVFHRFWKNLASPEICGNPRKNLRKSPEKPNPLFLPEGLLCRESKKSDVRPFVTFVRPSVRPSVRSSVRPSRSFWDRFLSDYYFLSSSFAKKLFKKWSKSGHFCENIHFLNSFLAKLLERK